MLTDGVDAIALIGHVASELSASRRKTTEALLAARIPHHMRE